MLQVDGVITAPQVTTNNLNVNAGTVLKVNGGVLQADGGISTPQITTATLNAPIPNGLRLNGGPLQADAGIFTSNLNANSASVAGTARVSNLDVANGISRNGTLILRPRLETRSVIVTPQAIERFTVQCPTSEIVINAGIETSQSGIQTLDSYPTQSAPGGQGWNFRLANTLNPPPAGEPPNSRDIVVNLRYTCIALP
jgi:hypothetical protein